MRLILYIALAIIIWRIVRAMTRSSSAPAAPSDRPRELVDAPRVQEIDYTRVRDAEWRDGDTAQRRDREDAGTE